MDDTIKQALLQKLTELSLEAKIADRLYDLDYSEDNRSEFIKTRAKVRGFLTALYLIPEISLGEIEKAENTFKVTIEKTV